MRCNRCCWFRRALAAAWVFLNAPAGLPADEPTPPAADAPRAPSPEGDAPLNLFLASPADLNAVWKALKSPDFVILRGDQYAKLRARTEGAAAGPAAPWAYAVGSVAVEGRVAGDLADLAVEFGAVLAADGPVWVPIRLDGQTLTRAREGDRDLPLRSAEAGAWQVELSGAGKHRVRVSLLVPVRTRPEGRRLDLVIPEAASTRLGVVVPQKVVDATAGPGEPVACSPLTGEAGATRLSADLTPRSRFGLAWRVDEEAAAPRPALLSAQGEIAVELDPGSFRTRSSWSIRSLRGTAKAVQVQFAHDDEVIEVDLDGQRPPAVTERAGGSDRLTIPLAEPLAPGQERRLVVSTRRKMPAGSVGRVWFTGFPLLGASEQTGAIGITPTGNLWVTGVAGRGVRQIDPRTELPADLRARPATELAYQFSEQPFELTLRVESSPPLVRAGARTTVVLEARVARVDTWLDVETSRGRLYDLTLGLPPGLDVESVGPPEAVGSLHTGSLPAALLPVATGGLRLLTLRLGARAQEAGRFAVHLVGRQAIDPGAGPVSVALFQPLGVSSAGGRVAVVTDPSLTADLADENSGTFRPALVSPPADWPWPAGRASSEPPMLWLRHDNAPVALPLRVTVHPPALDHSSTLKVHLARPEAEVQQEVELSARFGTFDHVDVSAPAAVGAGWDVEGATVAGDLGRGPQGERLVRLKLAPELSAAARLRFRYRLAIDPRLSPETPVVLNVPWFRVVGGAGPSGPSRASVTSASGLRAGVSGGSWSEAPEPGSPGPEDGQPLRLVPARADGPAPLALNVSAPAHVALPGLVAPRLALRTVQGPEGELRTTAGYWVESHESSLAFSLPPGAELLQVRLGGETVREVERLPRRPGQAGGLKVAFPARIGSGPALVEFAYVVPAARASGSWAPPRLLDGGVVQQTLWEVRVPWSRAVVGVPAGWTDRNEWYWDTYVWKRRPSATPAGLGDWVSGPPPRPRGPSEADPGADPQGDFHSYLFGRPGDPVDLPVRVAERAWLVAACSGSVLALGGLLILVWRPGARLVGCGAVVAAAAAAAFLHPSVTLLAAQSATTGVLLTALLALMQRIVERRRPGVAVYGEQGARASGFGTPGSTMSRVVSAGSDDSTAVRARPLAHPRSTMDHITVTPPVPAAGTGDGPGPGPLSEPGGRGGMGS